MAEKFFEDMMILLVDDDISKCPLGELGVDNNIGTFYYKDEFDITHMYQIGTIVDANANDGIMECTTEYGIFHFKPIPKMKEK